MAGLMRCCRRRVDPSIDRRVERAGHAVEPHAADGARFAVRFTDLAIGLTVSAGYADKRHVTVLTGDVGNGEAVDAAVSL